ncbi:GntR family transcriptional regulator [Dactylosporangium sp. CA-092794]|uniref:GntR family transcriptional regulator n=1 Tax=Dactylosporangium sp. CA-092794 TaxID=3239929 RepID=UPI003D921FA9
MTRRAAPRSFEAGTMTHLPALLTGLSSTSNQTELAYQTIRRRIIELDLVPDSMFTELKLAEELGVSKTPVREALVRLQQDGLVAPVPRAGYGVQPVTLKTTRDLCEFRSIVEPKAAELAASRPIAQPALQRLQELAESNLAVRYPADRAGVERYLRDHFEFQAIIANACGNDRLAASIVGVLNDLERVLRLCLGGLPWSDARADQRIAIVAAISNQEPAVAFERMLERTQDAQREIIEALISSPSVSHASISIGV